jgi:alpha-N-arabinofuranosidase
VGHRQQHINSRVTTSLRFQTSAEHEKAGLVVFQNEYAFLYMCKSSSAEKPVIQIFKSPGNDSQPMELLAEHALNGDAANPILIRIESKGGAYSFSYLSADDKWKVLADNVDGTFLSTRRAGGFVGCVFGLYATSSGKRSSNSAYYDWFEYAGKDPSLD